MGICTLHWHFSDLHCLAADVFFSPVQDISKVSPERTADGSSSDLTLPNHNVFSPLNANKLSSGQHNPNAPTRCHCQMFGRMLT